MGAPEQMWSSQVLTSPVRGALTVTAVLALGVLGACTGDDASPRVSSSAPASPTTSPSESATQEPPVTGDVFRDARTAALTAESARIEGTLRREKKAIEVEVEGTASGDNQQVFLTADGGGRAEVLTVGEDYWLGGDEAFWTEQTGDAAAGRDMVGKYVPITKADAEELGSFTLRSILTETLSEPAVAAMETSTDPVEADEVDGAPAYVLSGDDGARLWVMADGSATVLRLVGPSADPTDLTFTRWGRVDTFAPPDPSTVVDQG